MNKFGFVEMPSWLISFSFCLYNSKPYQKQRTHNNPYPPKANLNNTQAELFTRIWTLHVINFIKEKICLFVCTICRTTQKIYLNFVSG